MAETDTTTKTEKVTYHRDRLIAEAGAFFGHPPHVVSAALGEVKSGKTSFTRDEAEKAIQSFLDRPVEMSYGTQTGVPDENGVI